MFIVLETTIKNGQVIKLTPTEELKVLTMGIVEQFIFIATLEKRFRT